MSQLSEYNHSTDSEKKKEDWMNAKWRPMMGWMYMFVCVFDFVLAPIGWTSIQALFHGGINTQWQPLTLQGGGLFHVAMGAVSGISAYGRTKEKLEGVAGSNQPMGTQYVPPGGMPGQMGMGGMNSGMGGGFGGCTINLVKKGRTEELIDKVSGIFYAQFSRPLKTYLVNIDDGTSLALLNNEQ